MYLQNAAVTLAADGLTIDWKITPGPLLARVLWESADRNGDGVISPAEEHA